jgi:hypothetical protein
MSKDLRIGDAERDAAVAALGEHFAAGRIDAQEYEERSSTAWAARSAGALAPLFEDLPAPHPHTPATGPAPRSEAGHRPAWGPRIPPLPMTALWVTLAVVIGPWFPLMVLAWFWFYGWGHRGWHHGGPWPHRHQREGRLNGGVG